MLKFLCVSITNKQTNKQTIQYFFPFFQNFGPNFESRKMAGSSKINNANVGLGNSPSSQ